MSVSPPNDTMKRKDQHKPDWQPIATAPKNGSKVLIFADGQQYAAWWDKTFDLQCGANGRTKYTAAWTDGAVASFGFEETKSYEPTHWMPLPPNPKPAEA